VARSYYDEGEVVSASGTQLYYGPDRLGSVRGAVAFNGQSSTRDAFRGVAPLVIIVLQKSYHIILRPMACPPVRPKRVPMARGLQ
jgi:hypothetical protein